MTVTTAIGHGETAPGRVLVRAFRPKYHSADLGFLRWLAMKRAFF